MPNQWTKTNRCARGHKYTPENTISHPCPKHKSGIKRQCRKCKSMAMKIRRRDLKAAHAVLTEAAEPRFAPSGVRASRFSPAHCSLSCARLAPRLRLSTTPE